MKRQRIAKSSDVLKKRQKRFFIKIVWLLLFFVIFLFSLSFVSKIENLLIKDVLVYGNEALDEEDVKNEEFDYLSKNVFVFFSGKNKFIYSKRGLSEYLKKNISRILDVKIERDKDSLIINLTERERAYLWCGEAPQLYNNRSSEKECFFMDKNGFIFDVAPSFSSGIYFTFYSGLKELDKPLGQHILDFDFLKNVEVLVSALKEKSLPTHSLVVLDDGQYELLININTFTGDYAKILFYSEQAIDEVYNKINSIIDADPFKTDFLEKRNYLEYIDTRFKNRVFYRFTK